MLGQRDGARAIMELRRTRRLKRWPFDILMMASALAVNVPEVANATEGWYARADIGAPIEGSVDISSSAPLGGDASYEGGALMSAGMGYAFLGGWRLEGEFARRQNDLGAAPLLDPGGSMDTTALMANLYWDFGAESIRPYFGLGVGYAKAQVRGRFTPALSSPILDDSDSGVAYQLSLGVAVELTEHVTLDLGYRYFAAPDFEGAGATSPASAFPVEADIDHQALAVGLRWSY